MKAAAWKAACLLAPIVVSALVLPDNREQIESDDYGGENDIAIIQLSRQKLVLIMFHYLTLWQGPTAPAYSLDCHAQVVSITRHAKAKLALNQSFKLIVTW